MSKLTTTELAKLIGITKQAVSKAARDGIIEPCERTKKNIYYDTEDPNVKFYIENDPKSGPREKTSKKPVKKTTVKKNVSKKPAQKTSKNNKSLKKPADLREEDPDDLSAVEINRRAKIADMQKKQMHVEILKKKYIPTDYVENQLFRYIERLNSTMERSAGVFITEVGEKILENGHIMPEHIESFVNLILEAIDNTKKAVIKDIKKYEPKI